MVVGAATAVIAQGRMTGEEESINQFADCRVATACCFAGRMADVDSAAMLEKALEKWWTRVVMVAGCCCHSCCDVLATWFFITPYIIVIL